MVYPRWSFSKQDIRNSFISTTQIIQSLCILNICTRCTIWDFVANPPTTQHGARTKTLIPLPCGFSPLHLPHYLVFITPKCRKLFNSSTQLSLARKEFHLGRRSLKTNYIIQRSDIFVAPSR